MYHLFGCSSLPLRLSRCGNNHPLPLLQEAVNSYKSTGYSNNLNLFKRAHSAQHLQTRSSSEERNARKKPLTKEIDMQDMQSEPICKTNAEERFVQSNTVGLLVVGEMLCEYAGRCVGRFTAVL